jgi:hypothetical protein
MVKLPDDDEINVIQSGTVTLTANSHMSLGLVSVGTALSLSHISAAAYFARQSFAIETGLKAYDRADAYSQQNDHRAYVMGAIFMSVAFLDAIINEACDDHKAELVTSQFWPVAPGVAKKWQKTPPTTADDALLALVKIGGTLERYRAFLSLRGMTPPLGPGDVVYDRAKTLCTFRNRLIHYEAIWQDYPGGQFHRHRHDIADLRAKLQAEFEARPAGNALFNVQYPFGVSWVHQVLSHACAEWAVTSSKDFVDAFYQAAGIPRRYEWSSLPLDTR